MTSKSVSDTGHKLAAFFSEVSEALEDLAPTEEELSEFNKYLTESMTLGPLFNPSAFTDGNMFDAISMARERVRLIRDLRRHFEDNDRVRKELVEEARRAG